MFSSDQETYNALNALIATAQNSSRPLVIWIGAGASAWAGYPGWQEVAGRMHTLFSRQEPSYDKSVAARMLSESRFPELFEQMRLTNQPRYFATILEAFGPKPSTGVHARLIRTLRLISPIRIVTTNVDEAIEHNLAELETVQRSDIERLPQLLYDRKPFVCKAHGSTSAVETIVFSQRDYDLLAQDSGYLAALCSLFSDASVFFLGYGLRDDYLIRLLLKSAEGRPLFGIGPHFVVTTSDSLELPSTVRPIRYLVEAADHRDALLALEAVADVINRPGPPQTFANEVPAAMPQSIYYIGDLVVPGTITTSQTLGIEAPSGDAFQMVIGEGYVDGEVELHNYSALHDVVVGLICFDVVCFSIDHLAIVHDLLGSEVFWVLVTVGAIRLVLPPSEPSVMFKDEEALVGDLGATTLGSKSSSAESFSPIGASEKIRKLLSPAPGKDSEAERLFQLLESTILDASDIELSSALPHKTRSALMHPSIRRLLGVSGGTPINAVPRWLAFPILRLANVIRRGQICQRINASATRIIWGSERLASAAFSVSAGQEWADDAASYALTGRFNSDIGSIVAQQPELLLRITDFRQSAIGASFRREVAQRLEVDEGGKIVIAINAGLRQALPMSVLEKARDQLSGLFVPRETIPRLLPAFWGDLRNADARIGRWRKRSRALLDEECKRRSLGPYDACPCGSGEKLKFCCVGADGQATSRPFIPAKSGKSLAV